MLGLRGRPLRGVIWGVPHFAILCISVHLLLLVVAVSGVVGLVYSAAGLGGCPGYAIDDVLVVVQDLHDGVVEAATAPALRRAPLTHQIAVPDDDALVFAGGGEKFSIMVDGNATDPF